MLIATFNVNDVNRRLANLLAWLERARPDVVCLQELKATNAGFPAGAIRGAGYEAVWQGQKTWNGVAILSRGLAPVVTRRALPGDVADTQSRYIEAAVGGVLIGCLYLPNGNPRPGPKFDYKLAWFERLIAHAEALVGSGVPAVLAGDYNVVPRERDIYPSKSYAKSWAGNALVQPQSRAAFGRLLAAGWVDALGTRFGEESVYTFWPYLRDGWSRNAGLRLDHLLVSPSLAGRVEDAGVDREVRAEANASDHAPAWVRLRDDAASVGRRRALRGSAKAR